MSIKASPDGTPPSFDKTAPVGKTPETGIVNLEPLPSDLQNALKGTKNVSGAIDDYKGAVFQTKRDPIIQFHIKPMPAKPRYYLIKVSGDEKQTRRKEKNNRGHSFNEVQVRNFSINWNVNQDLIKILLRKIKGRENSTSTLHGRKDK